MPSVLEFTQDDFEPAWQQTQLLLPVDPRREDRGGHQRPLLVHHRQHAADRASPPQVEGFWVAEAVWVTHSAGVGAGRRRVARRRRTARASTCTSATSTGSSRTSSRRSTSCTRDCQNFVEVYDILHPLQPTEDPRPLRTSPFHQRQRELGAVFLEASGWERPQWYAANAGLRRRHATSPTPERLGRAVLVADRRRRGAGDPRGRRDVRHDGAEAARGHRPGRRRVPATAWSPATWTSPSARSPTACCSTSTAGSAATSPSPGWAPTVPGRRQRQPRPGLAAPPPAGRTAPCRSATSPPGTCCIGLWGPRARDLLQPLTDTDCPHDGLQLLPRRPRPTSARSRSPRCGCPTSASSAGSSTPRPTTA